MAPSCSATDGLVAGGVGRPRTCACSSSLFFLFRRRLSQAPNDPTNPVSIEPSRIQFVVSSRRLVCSPLRKATVPGCAGKSSSLSVDGAASCPASGRVAATRVLVASSSRVISAAAELESDGCARRSTLADIVVTFSAGTAGEPLKAPALISASSYAAKRSAMADASARSMNFGGFLVDLRYASMASAIGPAPLGPTTSTAATCRCSSAGASSLRVRRAICLASKP